MTNNKKLSLYALCSGVVAILIFIFIFSGKVSESNSTLAKVQKAESQETLTEEPSANSVPNDVTPAEAASNSLLNLELDASICDPKSSTVAAKALFIYSSIDLNAVNIELLETGSLDYMLPDGSVKPTAEAEYLSLLPHNELVESAQKGNIQAMTLLADNQIASVGSAENMLSDEVMQTFEEATKWAIAAAMNGKPYAISNLYLDTPTFVEGLEYEYEFGEHDESQKQKIMARMQAIEKEYIFTEMLNSVFVKKEPITDEYRYEPTFIDAQQTVEIVEESRAKLDEFLNEAATKFGTYPVFTEDKESVKTPNSRKLSDRNSDQNLSEDGTVDDSITNAKKELEDHLTQQDYENYTKMVDKINRIVEYCQGLGLTNSDTSG